MKEKMNKRKNNIHIHICIQKKKIYLKQGIKDRFDLMLYQVEAINKKQTEKMSD